MESRPASSVFRWAATGQEVGLRLRAGQRSARERGVSQVSPSAERMPLPPLSSPLLPSPPRYRWGGTELPMTCERSRPLARQRPWRPGAATGIQPSYRFASCGRAKPGDILFRYTVQVLTPTCLCTSNAFTTPKYCYLIWLKINIFHGIKTFFANILLCL